MCIQSQSPRPLIGSTSSIDFPQTRRTSLFTHSAAVRCKCLLLPQILLRHYFKKRWFIKKDPPPKKEGIPSTSIEQNGRRPGSIIHTAPNLYRHPVQPNAGNLLQPIFHDAPLLPFSPSPLLPRNVISFMCGMAADCCSPDCLSCACSRHAPPPARRLPTLPPL